MQNKLRIYSRNQLQKFDRKSLNLLKSEYLNVVDFIENLLSRDLPKEHILKNPTIRSLYNKWENKNINSWDEQDFIGYFLHLHLDFYKEENSEFKTEFINYSAIAAVNAFLKNNVNGQTEQLKDYTNWYFYNIKKCRLTWIKETNFLKTFLGLDTFRIYQKDVKEKFGFLTMSVRRLSLLLKPKEKTMNKLLDIKQLSEMLNIKKSTIYSYIHRKTIPFIKIGGRVLFDPIEIQNFVDQNTFTPLQCKSL